jgi:hypothetical protein
MPFYVTSNRHSNAYKKVSKVAYVSYCAGKEKAQNKKN